MFMQHGAHLHGPTDDCFDREEDVRVLGGEEFQRVEAEKRCLGYRLDVLAVS